MVGPRKSRWLCVEGERQFVIKSGAVMIEVTITDVETAVQLFLIAFTRLANKFRISQIVMIEILL